VERRIEEIKEPWLKWYRDADLIDKKQGIYLSPEKSRWVKKGGKWLRPLKFLGLKYDGRTNQLRAATRNGSELIYDKEKLIQALVNRSLGTGSYKENYKKSWEGLLKSKFFGFVQSRLYNGA